MVQSIRQNMQEDSITEPKKRKNDLKQIVTLRKDVCLSLNCDYFKTKNIRGDFSPIFLLTLQFSRSIHRLVNRWSYRSRSNC